MRIFSYLCVLSLAACGDPSQGDHECTESEEPAQLKLALSSNELEPMFDVVDNDDAMMQIGSQGGFHIWVHAKTRGLCPHQIHIEREIRMADTNDLIGIGATETDLQTSETSPDWNETLTANAAVVCQPPIGVNIVDANVTLKVTVRDQFDKTATDERVLNLRCPTEDTGVFNTCHSVCNNEV